MEVAYTNLVKEFKMLEEKMQYGICIKQKDIALLKRGIFRLRKRLRKYNV